MEEFQLKFASMRSFATRGSDGLLPELVKRRVHAPSVQLRNANETFVRTHDRACIGFYKEHIDTTTDPKY
jgi:hypothetical protein